MNFFRNRNILEIFFAPKKGAVYLLIRAAFPKIFFQKFRNLNLLSSTRKIHVPIKRNLFPIFQAILKGIWLLSALSNSLSDSFPLALVAVMLAVKLWTEPSSHKMVPPPRNEYGEKKPQTAKGDEVRRCRARLASRVTDIRETNE